MAYNGTKKERTLINADKKNAAMLQSVYNLFTDFDVPITPDDYIKATDLYFNYCIENDMRVGVEGLCAVYGISSKHFFDVIERGLEFDARSDIFAKARQVILAYYEQLNITGKLNPAMGIFLLKNWAEYKDEKRIAQTTLKIETKASAEQLEEKYLKDLPDAEFREVENNNKVEFDREGKI